MATWHLGPLPHKKLNSVSIPQPSYIACRIAPSASWHSYKRWMSRAKEMNTGKSSCIFYHNFVVKSQYFHTVPNTTWWNHTSQGEVGQSKVCTKSPILVPIHQTCLVGPREGMLVANWLCLCHYPIHCLYIHYLHASTYVSNVSPQIYENGKVFCSWRGQVCQFMCVWMQIVDL